MARIADIAVVLPVGYLVYFLLLYRRTRVPYVATPSHRLTMILKHLPLSPSTVIYDLGSGSGTFLFAAEKYGVKQLKGFELSPLHYWYARLKGRILSSRVHFYRRDFFTVNFGEADIIYIFLVQSVVEQLWPKIIRETKPGTMVAILANAPFQARPHKIITLDEKQGSKLYLYAL